MNFEQHVTHVTKCFCGGGGSRCDTLCCILNCWLELLCLCLMLGTFFLPAFSIDANATNAPGTLGVCNIENPTYFDGGNVAAIQINASKPASVYNRVYFGTSKSTTNISIDS